MTGRQKSWFWMAAALVLTAVLQWRCGWHFMYSEQNQVFLFDRYYISETLGAPGGVSTFLADFGQQFFCIPWAGALISALLLTLTACMTGYWLAALSDREWAESLGLLATAPAMILLTDGNFLYQSLIVQLMLSVVLTLLASIQSVSRRPLVLFLVSLVPIAMTVWAQTKVPSFAIFFEQTDLPAARFPFMFAIPALGAVALCLRLLPQREYGQALRNVLPLALSLLLTLALSLPFMPKADSYEKLDHYVRVEDWDGVLRNYRQKDNGEVLINDLCCYNLALLHRGELAENAFRVLQADDSGLLPEWNRNGLRGALLSDIYFATGQIALAQRMAFETNVNSYGEFNPRMLKRLVQTNIVYGTYDVAEKYISLLEKTLFYREWAHAQRLFLNDVAVEADPAYGELRRCIPPENFMASSRGIDMDLKDIVAANPDFSPAREYLGMLYLLGGDYESFKVFLDTFYGKGASIPKAFREAAIIISEMYPGYWKTLGIKYDDYRRYNDFVTKLQNRIDVDAFKDTFWYYLMLRNQ